MDKTLFGWYLTDHAKTTMTERGISAAEIVEAIREPTIREEIENGGIYWTHASGVAWLYGKDPSTGTPARFIATVLLSGENQVTWRDEAPYLVVNPQTAESLFDVLTRLARPTATKKPLKKPFRRSGSTNRSGPVITTSRFDGVPQRTIDSVREQLEAMGLDPNDLSVVRRDGNKLIIDM